MNIFQVSLRACMGVFVTISKRDAPVSETEQSNEGAGDISCL